MPVLGLPGWFAENDCPDRYNDAASRMPKLRAEEAAQCEAARRNASLPQSRIGWAPRAHQTTANHPTQQFSTKLGTNHSPHNDHNSKQPVDETSASPERSEGSDSNAILTFIPLPARALSVIDFERRVDEKNELIVRPNSLHELRQRVGVMESNPSLRSGRTVGEGAGCPPHNDHSKQQTANSKQQTATGRSSIRSPVTGRSSIRSP